MAAYLIVVVVRIVLTGHAVHGHLDRFRPCPAVEAGQLRGASVQFDYKRIFLRVVIT